MCWLTPKWVNLQLYHCDKILFGEVMSSVSGYLLIYSKLSTFTAISLRQDTSRSADILVVQVPLRWLLCCYLAHIDNTRRVYIILTPSQPVFAITPYWTYVLSIEAANVNFNSPHSPIMSLEASTLFIMPNMRFIN